MERADPSVPVADRVLDQTSRSLARRCAIELGKFFGEILPGREGPRDRSRVTMAQERATPPGAPRSSAADLRPELSGPPPCSRAPQKFAPPARLPAPRAAHAARKSGRRFLQFRVELRQRRVFPGQPPQNSHGVAQPGKNLRIKIFASASSLSPAPSVSRCPARLPLSTLET